MWRAFGGAWGVGRGSAKGRVAVTGESQADFPANVVHDRPKFAVTEDVGKLASEVARSHLFQLDGIAEHERGLIIRVGGTKNVRHRQYADGQCLAKPRLDLAPQPLCIPRTEAGTCGSTSRANAAEYVSRRPMPYPVKSLVYASSSSDAARSSSSLGWTGLVLDSLDGIVFLRTGDEGLFRLRRWAGRLDRCPCGAHPRCTRTACRRGCR